MAVNRKIKVGVVGLGKMGVMHACLLNTFPDVKVAALCDKSRLMRMVAKRAFKDALITDNLDKFAPLGLDAIYVLTPIPIHYPLIKQIYSNELTPNVFVEKTLTSTYAHSKELSTLSDKYGVNMVGYMKRFGVTFNKAETLLKEGVLGSVVSFDAYAFSSDFSDVPEGSTVSKARGGVIEDLGSHVVDLALWLLGDLKVTFAKANSKIAADSEDDVTFGVVGDNDLQGKFDISWRKVSYRMPEFGLTIRGTKGILNVNDDEVRLENNQAQIQRWYRADIDDNVGFLLGGSEYYRENRHFIDSVAAGSATKSDFKSALKVDFLLNQVRKQCK
jgi:predicted dehydrogenase